MEIKKAPLVSVIIPVYNAGEFLRDAVVSILNQTYKNLEIIIIDDGCTDGCMATIQDLDDSKITIIRQSNSGKAAALNRALDVLNGDFFTIQDADDLSYSCRIQSQVKCLEENPQLAAVFTGHDIIIGDKQFGPTFLPKSIEECQEDIQNYRIPAHDATGLYRWSIVRDIRFDPSLRIGQGVDYILKVGEQFPVKVLRECLYTYRINYNSNIRKDPKRTICYMNSVIQRACKRRGLDFELYKKDIHPGKKFSLHRTIDTHIVPHCMESILHLRRRDNFFEALKVGIVVARLHPIDPYYYKPLLYALFPFSLIKGYRAIKTLTK